jgi:hypothetical protein
MDPFVPRAKDGDVRHVERWNQYDGPASRPDRPPGKGGVSWLDALRSNDRPKTSDVCVSFEKYLLTAAKTGDRNKCAALRRVGR